jgi:TPR repeat protein/transposase
MSNAKSKSDTFVFELPLKVRPAEEKKLLVRLDCARQLYNNCLGESLRRLRLMRASEEFLAATKSPAGKGRTEAFRTLDESFGFREYDLHAYATKAKNACHIGDHLDSHVCQKIATRAFDAARQFAFGKRGEPRFKGPGQLDSVEGKTNSQGLRFVDGSMLWLGLELKCMLDPKDKRGVQKHALGCGVKYVRLVRKEIKGKNRFYAQLVLEGRPLFSHPAGEGVVGLDLGPSTIAAVSADDAFIEAFCAELEPIRSEARILQRGLARSRRAVNPEAFNADGTLKKGAKLKKSNRYKLRRAELAEANRRLAAARKRLQGRMANRVLGMGASVNMERLSYRGWQRVWGRSVGFRAPGMFVERLRRKAIACGGSVNEFPPDKNKLSQVCHSCGAVEKKPLSQRWHNCECGVSAQRDLYSAFLAMHVAGDDLDFRLAREAWPGAEPLLRRAMSRCEQAAIGEARLASFGLDRSRSGSRDEEGSARDDNGVVEAASQVAEMVLESLAILPSEPPAFRPGEVQARTYDFVSELYLDGHPLVANQSWIPECFRQAADEGNAEAQAILGDCHRLGRGFPIDLAKAREQYALAAEKDHPRAVANLACMLMEGEGGERNKSQAVKEYKRAASLGDQSARMWLALLHIDGRLLPKDRRRAAGILAHVVDAGAHKLPGAYFSLALLLSTGEGGVPLNPTAAKHLYCLAARDGFDMDLIRYGQGLYQDYRPALFH